MSDHQAFGAPGAVPHWDHADKDAVGAAYTASNRVWFTLWRGAVTEVYYPNVDRAQIRSLQLVVTDGSSFVHCERDDFDCDVARINSTSQAYRVTGRAREGGYSFEKTVICDPDLPCVLQRYKITDKPGLRSYFICHPHLEEQGYGSVAHVQGSGERKILMANRADLWLALGCTDGFGRGSVGFAGASDGLTDLQARKKLLWEFTEANNGNVVLAGEVPEGVNEFTVVLAFGHAAHGALTALTQSMASSFDDKLGRYLEQWRSGCKNREDLSGAATDQGKLYQISCDTLCCHEDRIYPGALIASLSIPWGQVKRAVTQAHAGYHLVWPRDAISCAGAMLAAGDRDTPLRTLTYLSVSQRANGSFAQNFWIDGDPNWTGLQLDEVTYPVLLARKLHGAGALLEFDPLPMVYKAAEYIAHRGPITPQERWEQMSGYSPSTLAIVIAAMVCAAAFAREDGKAAAAGFLEDYADWMRDHIDAWTVTTCGELVPGHRRHIIRITPAQPGDGGPVSPNTAVLKIPDQKPGAPDHYPARNIVDAGFLELVRYGVLAPDDPLVIESLQVVDAVLKVDTPFGPCWRRFNHDGYGQRGDGGPYDGWGVGRAWPLLTGERGHYVLRTGGDARPYVAAMEALASRTGLIPEQVWDEPFWRDGKNYFGRPTGSANPLAWAHSEYVKLIRSVKDNRVYDLPPEVEQRYAGKRGRLNRLAMWTRGYPVHSMEAGETLRVYAREPFLLRYSFDNWEHIADATATDTGLSIHYVDTPTSGKQTAPIRFTFYWILRDKWHGCDYSVAVTHG